MIALVPMKQTYKLIENDLLLYMYNELTANQRLDVEQAMDQDDALYDLYNDLADSRALLAKPRLEPQPDVLDRIMRHSRQTAMVFG